MASKPGRVVTCLKLPPPLEPRARLRDKLKSLYLHYYSAYDHQA